MELCQNGKSVRMDFAIFDRGGGQIAVVKATIPIDQIDEPSAWNIYAVNAFLHSRMDSEGKPRPTHKGERAKYSAKPMVDYHSRHSFVEGALKHRAAIKSHRMAWRKVNGTKVRRKSRPVPERAEQLELPENNCPQCINCDPIAESDNNGCPQCGYLDPQAAFAVKCPQCDYQE